MNIGYLLPNLHITGGARVPIEIGSRLVSRGHRFFILIPRNRNRFGTLDQVEVIESGWAVKNPFLAIVTGCLGIIHNLPEVDVLIASMPPYALLAQYLGNQRRIPVVNYVLNDDIHFFDDGSYFSNPVLLHLYRLSARLSLKRPYVVANSNWTAVKCVTGGGQKPQAIIPSGYDPGIFYEKPAPQNDSGRTRLLTVGRKPHWKGFRDLIMSLNLIDLKTNPFELRVITQDELDLTSAKFPIEVVKPEDDLELAEHYRWGEIFIHSSWFEGFGLPPLEAQACGTAVVATNSGGVREFLRHGYNSYLVPPREPATLAKKIKSLMENEDQRKIFQKNGLISCQEFTWDRITDKFEKFLFTLRDVNGTAGNISYNSNV